MQWIFTQRKLCVLIPKCNFKKQKKQVYGTTETIQSFLAVAIHTTSCYLGPSRKQCCGSEFESGSVGSVFLSLIDPDPYPLVRGMDTDHSIIKQK